MTSDVPRRAAGKKPRWTAAQKMARAKTERGSARTGVHQAPTAPQRRTAPDDAPRYNRSGGAPARGAPARGAAARGAAPSRFARAGVGRRADERRDDERRPPVGARRDGQRRPDTRGDASQRTDRADRPDRSTQEYRRDRPERSERTEGRPDVARRPARADATPGGRWQAQPTSRGDWQPSRGDWQPRRDADRQRPGVSRDTRGRDTRGRDTGRRPDHYTQALLRKERPPRPEASERASAEPVATATVDSDNAFLTAGLPMPLVRRLAADGIDTPFPIQQATLPDALAGRDVLGRGQTGSGKTLAFGLPMFARLAEVPRAVARRPLAIVLVPTRELAIQVNRALEPIARTVGLRLQLVAGGLSYLPQITALDRGVEVLIATPGRLVDLMEKRAADLSDVRIAVLDEADHMAEMGFVPEVTAILDAIPSGGQRLLFSATLDRGVDKIVATYLRDPVTHSTDDVTAAVTTMEHHVLLIQPPHKKQVIAEVANRPGRTLVFSRTKLGAERVAEQLREQGVFAAALHGGLNQNARGRILTAFREGVLPVLVATDVAARGLHVEGIGLVLQVDPPADHKDYLHRAGRTARAGERGVVVTLALPHQQKLVQRLARDAGVKVTGVPGVPGDPALSQHTGARRPHLPPIPAEQLRRIVEGDPARRRHGIPAGRRSSPRSRSSRG